MLALCAGFAGLGYRLVDLQILQHEKLKALAERRTRMEMVLEPIRGDILDRNGVVLATSKMHEYRKVCADPTFTWRRQAQLARLLSGYLGQPATKLHQQLLPQVRKKADGSLVTNRYVVLKEKVEVETWNRIHDAMTRLQVGIPEEALTAEDRRALKNLRRSVFAQKVEEQERDYPNERLGAHVLGFTGWGETEVNRRKVTLNKGKEGIERVLDAKLRGVPGLRISEKDARQDELITFRDLDVEPQHGQHVVLTIDSVVQHILEEELAVGMKEHNPISIGGVVLKPRTGEILAMANLPDFDPNRPGDFPASARRNRLITDVIEPGSTFKAIVIAGALSEGLVGLEDKFYCEQGRFYYGGRVLHDHDPYKDLTVEQIITKSSNIGAAKIGLLLGPEKLQHYIRAFGFGARTGVPLLGESPGIVHPISRWSKVSIVQLPMGHGIAVNRLQMMMAMAAMANDGWLMRPMLVDRIVNQNGEITAKYYPQRVRQVVSARAARDMMQAMKTVPREGGTARAAQLDRYTVAGKTGTAQKVKPTGGYYQKKFVASFIGFLPADNTELCIGIFLDEPRGKYYYGGLTAAPVFKRCAERMASYLAIPPDVMEEPEEPNGDDRVAKRGAALAYRSARAP